MAQVSVFLRNFWSNHNMNFLAPNNEHLLANIIYPSIFSITLYTQKPRQIMKIVWFLEIGRVYNANMKLKNSESMIIYRFM